MTRPTDAARSSWSNGSPSSEPGGRLPLPPPQGVRPGGMPRPLGPRFAPPPPGRRLTPAQGMRLGLLWLVIVVLGGAAGLAFTLPMTKLYAARINIEYDVSAQDTSNTLRTDRDMTTQALLLTGRGVLGPVAQANGIDPDQLAEDTTATVLTGADPGNGETASNIIAVTVLNADRDAGVKLANAIGQQYLKVVAAASPVVYLQQQIDAAKHQLSTASATDAAVLQSRITTLQGQLDVQNMDGNHAAIVAPSYSGSEAAYPNPLLAAATGTLCGIVVACLVAIGLSRRWTRS
jgi:capsular polysaccharide biosynthesis protein